MQHSEIYDEKDYRDMFRARLQHLKSVDPGSYSAQKLAKFARVHPPFLSAVLNKKLHFNSDQVFLASKFLGLSKDETDYVELVFEENRTSSRVRRQELQLRIKQLRRKLARTSNAIQSDSPDISVNAWQEYFLYSRHQMLHMAMTIEKYRLDPASAAQILQVGAEDIHSSLRLLQQLNIIGVENGEYVVLRQDLHLPEESPLVEIFQNSARLVALRKRRHPDDTRFSVFLSCDTKTAIRIRAEFNAFLKRIQPLVNGAPAAQVYQLNFDFLDWSE